ncbi:MAG TPA: flagellar basal body L-ring protein FlgH [Pirellulaceae bacterium]|jgi:hypothetical protein|nr:flagellar basal body L-ring protein FlgH [Pirellulaceae bacterium]
MKAITIGSIRRCACFAAVCVGSATGIESARGQSSSIYTIDPSSELVAPGKLVAPGTREVVRGPPSWTHVPPPIVRQLHIHDRIMVRVSELSTVKSEGEIQSRKDVQYDAVLNDWIRLIGLKAIKPSPQADGDQRISGDLKQLFRAEGDMETRESLILNITCTVADIRPNGDVVLEGHKQVQVNYESWEVSLSGICRYQDIGPDNTVLSK